MLEYIKKIKANGFITAILSDQTDWLDEINGKTPFITILTMSSTPSRSKRVRETPRYSGTSVCQ